jgi:hypothetical protein
MTLSPNKPNLLSYISSNSLNTHIFEYNDGLII